MSQFWYSDERWHWRSRCCCSLGVVVVVFGGDLLRWILGGFVLVNPLPCAACPGDGFFNEGVEGSLSVAPIGEVHEAHVSDKSCNPSNDVRMVPLARHNAGQEDFVGIQPKHEAGSESNLSEAFQEAVVSDKQRDCPCVPVRNGMAEVRCSR